MPDSTIVELIQYNNWANQQVLAACQKLTDEHLATAMPGAFGPIWDTLEHIIRSEAGYVSVLTGVRPPPPFNWSDRPSLAEMAPYAAQVAAALNQAVAHVAPTDTVRQEREGKALQYRAMAIYIQIINHGIEHRTNITTLLNQMQLPTPDVDGWGYLWSHTEHFGMEP
jgi:uncharacterized damage-inducible protein DinB